MIHPSLLLIALIGCSSPDAATAPIPVEAPTPTPVTLLEATADYHGILAARMQGNATAAKTYDAPVGAKAQQIVDAFAALVPVVLLGFDEAWNPIYENHVCTSRTESHIAMDRLSDPSQNQPPAAVWNGRLRLLVMNPQFAPDEAYLPFTGFHEGFHMLDPESRSAVNLDYRNLEEPSPREDAAIAFESRMINAVSRGRYDKLIAAWKLGIERGIFPSMIAHEIVVSEAPSDFRSIMAANGDIQQETPSLFFQVMVYDLNIAIAKEVTMSPEARARADALRYKRMVAALNEPATQQLVGYSLGDWLQ